jgi:hypothetical protein
MPNPIKPVQLNNVFTPEEYAAIYEQVNSIMERGVKDHNDKYAYMTKLCNGFIIIDSPEGFAPIVKEKLKALATELIGDPAEVGFLFARYTLESDDTPMLMPHCDKSEKKMGLYGTVELDATLQWDFYVEDEKFEMGKNNSVWFTGTHQPHWRPDKEFAPGDHYDILLAQTHSLSDTTELTDEDRRIMDQKATDTALKYKDSLLAKGYEKYYTQENTINAR